MARTHKKINIAIDGWSACGKGTMAKSLAKHFNYLFIDTGAMYRAFTLNALQNNISSDNNIAIDELIRNSTITFKQNPKTLDFEIYLNGNNVESLIRSQEINKHVSRYSELSSVRKFLVKQQQQIAIDKGVVMDGRDIGTVVLPDAELKIFMTASPEIRAQRRFLELKEKHSDITLEEIAKSLRERDHIDSTREDSPLKQAKDARVLDNSNLTRDEQLQIALEWANEALAKSSWLP
ncbi:MAG: (d)CMP kinase [Bacteroidia bacterium]|nr:(d)CMP kinase [Bacteroidia bacterium]MCO5253575.1 (d)CMP kinase [Bacteroidota bacterium]